MKKTVKKLMVTLALALMVTAFCGSGVQAKQKSQKLKVDNIYADYNKYVKGRCNLKKYRLVIKQGSKVLHNKTHYRNSFSVKIGTRNQGDKITVKIKKSRKKYASVTKQVKQTLWWQKDGYKSEKAVVKAYKTNDKKITVHCKTGYRLNVDITGNNGKNQKESNIQKSKTINVASGIDSIKKVTLTLYNNRKKISSNGITPDDAKSDTGKGNKPGVKKDNTKKPTQDVDWREDNIDKFLGQIEKSDTYRGTVYKLNDYTIYRECDSYQYGFITSPYWSLIDWYDEKEYKELLAEMQRIVEVTHIKDDMIDEEKAYRLGRYLAKNIDYYGLSEEHTAYGTLFNKKTVCAGYSTTFAILCRYVGIECDYVQTDEIGNHAWNLIKLGNYWYVVDITHAAVARNDRGITYSFFREYDYLSSNCKEHLDKDYWTDEYIVTHPIDTKSHYMRCKLEGRMNQTLSGDELYNLPE